MSKDGYGLHNRRHAHRVVYEQEVGPIPEGMYVDHLCRRRDCVFPIHLEPVTKSENEKRKRYRYRQKNQIGCRAKTKHPLNLYGAMTDKGGLVCRVCSGV